MASAGVNLGEIKIICRPCHKCKTAEALLRKAIKQLQTIYKVVYHFEIVKIGNLREAVKYSTNIANTPFIVINNTLVLAGKLKGVSVVRAVLLDMIKHQHILAKESR